jgi:hypothetical protein
VSSGEISAAVLCSGPSLTRFLAEPVVHDVYIGVNRTVTIYPCHWWCFTDVQAFGMYTAQRRGKRLPTICAPDATERKAWATHPQSKVHAYEWQRLELLPTTCPRGIPWQRYTCLSAVVLADHLGAHAITLYGCDWQGSKDWDGTENPGRIGRSQHRWNSERAACALVAEWLAAHNVRLYRVPKTGPIEELNEMARKPKDETPVRTPPAMPAETAEFDAVPVPEPQGHGVEVVRLRARMRLGQEELPAGHLLGKVELFEPVGSSQMLAQLIERSHAVVTPD